MNNEQSSNPDYILLVDDQLENLALLTDILRNQGYSVRRVLNGRSTLNLAQSEEAPALILLDIMMPEMDGYQVCQQLKTNQKTCDIPVIFISAIDDVQGKVKGFEVGGADYITKPFEMQEVIARVRHQIHLQKLQQQIKLDAELRQSLIKEQEINQFTKRIITILSQEYRIPLSMISTSAALLEQYCYVHLDEKQLKHFQTIHAMTDYLQGLLQDVMFVNTWEKDDIPLNLNEFDLSKFCESLITEILVVKQVQQKINYSSTGDCVAQWDERIWRQIVNHLLSNAIIYSAENSEIHVRVFREENFMNFQVEDQGIGISLEEKEKIFYPFYRSEKVSTIAGEGLGLTLVKKYVDLQRGQLNVKSEINQGTTITVTLPMIFS